MDASPPAPPSAEALIHFWREAGPQRWFAKDEDFDRDFREGFLAAHEAAVRGELASWAHEAESALALVLLLDQFPRNAFRGSPRMFASDAQARTVADAAIKVYHDRTVDPELRPFFYLPYEHSESLADQDQSVALFTTLGADLLRWAQLHREIIQRFGRFPHRNAVLGRVSTPEEERFLDEGGFAG